MDSRRRHLSLILAVLVVAVGGACRSGGRDAAVTATSTSSSRPAASPRPPVADGYRRIEKPDEGFSIDVPAGWRDVPYDGDAIRDLVESSRADNPELAAMLENTAGSETNLLVVDPSQPGANLNVLRIPHGRTLAPDEVEQSRDALLDPGAVADIDARLEAAGARDIRREPYELPAGPALRAEYVLPLQAPDGTVTEVTGVQYFIAAADAVYLLSLSTTDAAAYEDDFERIAQSLAVV